MNLISTLAIAMGSAWVSGINLYACVATLGLLSRFSHLRLPGELEVLTSWWVIGVAVGLYVIEFVADKVPYVDSTWDVIHTFIRVPAGAILAASAGVYAAFPRKICARRDSARVVHTCASERGYGFISYRGHRSRRVRRLLRVFQQA